jgi:hypothetical protein
MYGLPKDFDPQYFVARALKMLCFNANQIYLHFDERVTITLEGKYSLSGEAGDPIEIRDVPNSESRLFALIEKRVVSAGVEGGSTLVLAFETGAVFRCYDDSSQYESYQLSRGDDVIIV